MKNGILYTIIYVIIFAGFIGCSSQPSATTDVQKGADTTTVQTAELYICPMDTDIRSDKPGTCSKCGMDLEKQN